MILILLIINAPTPIKRMVHFLDAVVCRLSIGFSVTSSQKQQTQNETQIPETADIEKQRLDADSATEKPEEEGPTANDTTNNNRTVKKTRSPAVDANSGTSLYAKWGKMVTGLRKSTTKERKDAFEKYVIDEVYL